MSNESQVETESDAPQGRPSPGATLFAGPFGVVAAVIALGVIIGAAVFFAVGSDDPERAAFESRSFEDVGRQPLPDIFARADSPGTKRVQREALRRFVLLFFATFCGLDRRLSIVLC